MDDDEYQKKSINLKKKKNVLSKNKMSKNLRFDGIQILKKESFADFDDTYFDEEK